jgi:hypothetical protein
MKKHGHIYGSESAHEVSLVLLEKEGVLRRKMQGIKPKKSRKKQTTQDASEIKCIALTSKPKDMFYQRQIIKLNFLSAYIEVVY